MKISIKDFGPQSTGYKEEFELVSEDRFNDFKPQGPIKMKVELMKLDDGINATVRGLEAKIEFECEKCLKPYIEDIEIIEAERIFYFKKPAFFDDEADQADIFMVDTKQLQVDLTEMVRQEILLHFPTYQVCSSSCEGICAECGADLNEKKCKCKPVKKVENTPLAALKDMYK